MPRQLDNLVFDRTQSDVERVKRLTAALVAGTATAAERAEFVAGLKGAYNATDLNRVGAAVEYLTGVLHGMGYTVPTSPVTDWAEDSIQNTEQMAVYLGNIHKLRDCLPYVAPDAPGSMGALTWQQANAIEEILYRLEIILQEIQAGYLIRQAATPFMIAGGVFNA